MYIYVQGLICFIHPRCFLAGNHQSSLIRRRRNSSELDLNLETSRSDRGFLGRSEGTSSDRLPQVIHPAGKSTVLERSQKSPNSLPKFNSSPLKSHRIPIGSRIVSFATIFQGRAVKLQGCNCKGSSSSSKPPFWGSRFIFQRVSGGYAP